MDFNKFINDQKSIVSANSKNETETKKPEFKILYPFAPGSIEFRLLPNNKTNTAQRLVARHKIPDPSIQFGSKNVICSSFHYPDTDCPICKAIKNVQNKLGKECDVYSKYGAKQRGIAYAVITKIDPVYKDVNVGDTVILMYPKSVYTEIANQLIQNEQNLEYIFNQNEGCTFILETIKTSSFPEYKVRLNLGFNGPVFAKVKNTQDEYNAFLETIPSLDDTLVPSTMPDDLYNSALSASDLINVTYGCVSEAVSSVNNDNGATLGSIANKKTIDIVDDTPPAPANNGWNMNASNNGGWNMPKTETVNPTNNGGNPNCFGHHDDTSSKCMMCPHEMECMGF